jgi:IS30 family transposase
VVWSSRYLDIRERLQIADLLRLGCSLRRIAAELGRHPSTIKRELDRHRSPEGRYLPRTADHDARQQRARPRARKLTANITLRRLVQRKLNRCWSPDEVCGWLRKTYPDDHSMRLCPETIYRELLLRDNTTLHNRYCLKLRTGRRIRKSRWRTRTGHGPTITNKTLIDKRPASAETKLELDQVLASSFDDVLGGRLTRSVWLRIIDMPPATWRELDRALVNPLSTLLTLAVDANCPPLHVQVAMDSETDWLPACQLPTGNSPCTT